MTTHKNINKRVFLWLLAVATAFPVPGLTDVRAQDFTLERVALVQRHGVRTPTQGQDKLDQWSDLPWPDWPGTDWPAQTGMLTEHGRLTVNYIAKAMRQHFIAHGLLSEEKCPSSKDLVVWADGKDKRTHESGQELADSLAPGCGIQAGYLIRAENDKSPPDPIFNSLNRPCLLDISEVQAALNQAAGPEGITDADSRRALTAIQKILAPNACSRGGSSACLEGESTVETSTTDIKLQGPMQIGSAASEIFLLEYAEGMARKKVAWGKIPDLNTLSKLMPVQTRANKLTRQLPYVAVRRGSLMARLFLDTLDGDARPYGPEISAETKILALAGHDTNLSNMAGVFGLDWTLEEQPDATAPASALTLELWRDKETRKRYLKAVVWYATLEELRNLSPTGGHSISIPFADCGVGINNLCPFDILKEQVMNKTPASCKR
ncbi:histidine-type phosphatase [Candidatus Methylospira mobilis]|nr:histidine-type phosphatase [Candidatus Methylospira mobilis]WNV05034.1 histidine-type phosphatase [Candidatus Methylospira mobilis]